MKVLALSLAWIFLLMVFPLYPSIINAFQDTIVEPATEYGNITTGAGETTGNMTLANNLYYDRITSVTSLSSDHGPDSPAAYSWDTSTDTLTISGLATSQSRTITCIYNYDDTQDFDNSRQVLQTRPVSIAEESTETWFSNNSLNVAVTNVLESQYTFTSWPFLLPIRIADTQHFILLQNPQLLAEIII